MTTNDDPPLLSLSAQQAAHDAEDLVLGDVSTLLRVYGHVSVHGQVTGGASLAWGARLDVRGGFRGPAHLSPGSVLHVQGSFEGERVGTDGRVQISGQCPIDAARTPGTVVETGTVLVGDGGRCWTLAADGVLQSLGPSRHHTVSGTPLRRAMRWSQRRGRFVEV